MFRKTVRTSILLFTFVSGILIHHGFPVSASPVIGDPPQKVTDSFIPDPPGYAIETWAENLEIPWAIVFLSEHRALVTERAGRIRLIEEGRLQEKPYKVIEGVHHAGEGGLMGIAKHPEYPGKPYIYVMSTFQAQGKMSNRVERYRDNGNTLELDTVLVEDIPGHRVHNGGRIAFGPDGMLYICTGDIWKAGIAQDPENLGGKILRLTPDGKIPDDNPFEGSPVYSMGHRNPQGLAWHPGTGELFSSEHGPSGEYGLRERDENNVIKSGGNYGWPVVVGAAGMEPFIDPIIMWLRATPPSGMAFWDGRLFIATLRSRALLRVKLDTSNDSYEVNKIDRLFAWDWANGRYGRLRDAAVGPDGALYVLTNNRDGRGSPQPGDDRILRITKK